jgi:hypothetical protein
MDPDQEQKRHLAQADRHIAKVKKHILRQEGIVQAAIKEDWSSAGAESMLNILRAHLYAFERTSRFVVVPLAGWAGRRGAPA